MRSSSAGTCLLNVQSCLQVRNSYPWHSLNDTKPLSRARGLPVLWVFLKERRRSLVVASVISSSYGPRTPNPIPKGRTIEITLSHPRQSWFGCYLIKLSSHDQRPDASTLGRMGPIFLDHCHQRKGQMSCSHISLLGLSLQSPSYIFVESPVANGARHSERIPRAYRSCTVAAGSSKRVSLIRPG